MGVEGEVELELNLAHNWHTGQPKTPGKVQFSTDSQSVDLGYLKSELEESYKVASTRVTPRL